MASSSCTQHDHDRDDAPTPATRPSLLQALSYDALLDLLPFLDASSLGRLACTAQLFSLLVREARDHQPMFHTCRGDKAAIQEAIKRDLPRQPSVGLLFRQPRMTEAHVKDLLASLPHDLQMVGSTTRDVLCVPKVRKGDQGLSSTPPPPGPRPS